jgi:hypothetical protein
MDPKPPTIPTPELEPKLLSFEEFSNRGEYGDCPRYNNFFLHFDTATLNSRNKKKYYLKFKSEHKDLAKLLCDFIQELVSKPVPRSEPLKKVDRELYEAYKIMRGYGASDKDLFS